jgi:uncharacterized membrane protein YqjE
MSENGHSRRSAIGEFVSLLEDQMDLAALEWDYEKKHNLRRLAAVVVAAVLGFVAFILIQVAIVMGIASAGIPAGWACVIVAGAYVVIGAMLLVKFARRDPRVGAPFQGTRSELRKNLRWIAELFS